VADRLSGLQIVDISEPSNPVYAGSFNTPDYAFSVFISGGYAYVADHRSGLQVIDVSNPSNPTFVGSYDTPGFARHVFIVGDHIYLGNYLSLTILLFNPEPGIEREESLPSQYALGQNYPNPFNASTVIKYSLLHASTVSIEIYDVIGRKVESLIQGEQQAGHHQAVWNAKDHPSGMYFYRIQAGEYTATRKMVVLK
jgi:hypothetical protein